MGNGGLGDWGIDRGIPTSRATPALILQDWGQRQQKAATLSVRREGSLAQQKTGSGQDHSDFSRAAEMTQRRGGNDGKSS